MNENSVKDSVMSMQFQTDSIRDTGRFMGDDEDFKKKLIRQGSNEERFDASSNIFLDKTKMQ